MSERHTGASETGHARSAATLAMAFVAALTTAEGHSGHKPATHHHQKTTHFVSPAEALKNAVPDDDCVPSDGITYKAKPGQRSTSDDRITAYTEWEANRTGPCPQPANEVKVKKK